MSTNETHIPLDVLADYFAEALDDAAQEAVELHVADCDRCAASARWVHSLPLPSLEGWTAKAHGEEVLRRHLVRQLEEPDAEPGLGERLRRWRERLAGQSLHLIKAASGRLSRGLDVLVPRPGWEAGLRFEPATAGAESFKAGEEPDAGPSADVPTVRVVRRGIGIEVRVEHVGEGERPGMVALVPAREGGRPAVQVLRPTRDDPRTLVARFELEDEDFVIALEPGGWD